MKSAKNSASILAPPNPANIDMLRKIVEDLSPQALPEGAALFWSPDGGFQLHVPEPPAGESIPMPAYIMGLCFVRLTTDPYFKQEMMNWANRNQN